MRFLRISCRGCLGRELLALPAAALLACSGEAGPAAPDAGQNRVGDGFLYLVGNGPSESQNAVLAFQRTDDGNFVALAGSPFSTGGAGGSPSDANQQLVVSSDRRFLFAINTGSHSIAAFRIAATGALEAVSGSPFLSGGRRPVSVGLARDNALFAVNQGDVSSSSAPSYVGFRVSASGDLSQISESVVTVRGDALPTQALVSYDGAFLFGAEEGNPLLPFPLGALRSFRVREDGLLTEAPGSPTSVPYARPEAPRVVGLAAHPTLRFVYASYWTRNELAVFRYTEATAQLVFVTSVASSGSGAKSMVFNRAGTRLYTANVGSGTITVFDTSAPEAPAELQNEPAVPPRASRGLSIERELRAIALDRDERFLYVLDNWSEIPPGSRRDNSIHVFDVAGDGRISEAFFSDTHLQLPDVRAVGLAVP